LLMIIKSNMQVAGGWGREGYFVDPDILMATLGEIKDDISSIESEVSGIKL
jgi:hypothetical protein